MSSNVLAAFSASLAVLTGACTELDFSAYYSQAPRLPFIESAPDGRWKLHSAQTRLDQGQLVLTSRISREIARCTVAWPDEPCRDEDRDGLTDLWEELALYRLRPAVQLHPADRLLFDLGAQAEAIGRVFPVQGDPGRVRLLIVLAYSSDYGSCSFTAHHGDTERVALELEASSVAPETEMRVTALYTAAHEFTSVDGSTLARDVRLPRFETIEIGDTGEPRWLVLASRNKHATYLNRADCARHSRQTCLEEQCASPRDPPPAKSTLLFTIRNAGEPGAPLATRPAQYSHYPYTNLLPGSRSRESGYTYHWRDEPFCGNYQVAPSCAASVLEKLVHDPFESSPPR